MTPTVGKFEEGQVILVTAGTSGIGRCIAETFIAHGGRVHVCDINADALAGFLSDHPYATGSIADVASPGQVDDMFVELVDRYGRLDILVNNAGVAGPTAPVEEIGTEDWDRTIAIDLSGQFYVTRRAVPLLKQSGGGSIINVSSNAALFGCPLRSPYVASKWAMVGLT
jgi:NAD(P)-dependent dehydrogenase (short-subunit alcohol dehydrogenase family)